MESRLLELVGDAHSTLELAGFREELLAALLRAVPCDWVSINDLGPEPGDVVVLARPPPPAALYDAFARLAHQNPIKLHMERTGDGAPLRFSDVATAGELRALDLYREVYVPMGVEHQVAFTLPATPHRILAVALSRRDRDFSDEEVGLLRRARPHIVQAYRNAVEHTRLLRRLGDVGGLPTADLRARGLTAREVEVVRHVATGRSDEDAARALGISRRTVEKHLQHAFVKLGVHSRSEAARIAWAEDPDA